MFLALLRAVIKFVASGQNGAPRDLNLAGREAAAAE